MNVFDVLEIIGILLAFVDFFQLAGRLEARVDRLRNALKRLLAAESPIYPILGRMFSFHALLDIRPFDWMMKIGGTGAMISMIGYAVGSGVFDWFEGSLLQQVLLYGSGLSVLVFGSAVLIGLAGRPVVLFLLVLLPAVLGVLQVLDKPRVGTIGTVALLVALGSFLGQRVLNA